MRLFSLYGLVAALLLMASPAAAQCLHAGGESAAEARRREDALALTRMITNALAPPYVGWEQLGDSPRIMSLRGMGGPLGDLARRVRWGDPEPLPGWQIHYVANRGAYAVALTDTRDACRFTYYTDDSGVVAEGQPLNPRRPGMVPISPTALYESGSPARQEH
jgi:hypothetical protein